jgi:hypothetical protein
LGYSITDRYVWFDTISEEQRMSKLDYIGYALIGLLVSGIVGVDIYLLLELIKQPAITWLIIALIWLVAFVNVIAAAMTVLLVDTIGMG